MKVAAAGSGRPVVSATGVPGLVTVVAAPDTDARRPTRACHPEAHVDNPAHHPPECHWSTQPQGCDTSRRHMPIDCPHAADGTASKIGVENSLSFRDEGGGHAGDSAHQQSRPDLLRPKPADGCRDRVGGIRQPHREHGRRVSAIPCRLMVIEADVDRALSTLADSKLNW